MIGWEEYLKNSISESSSFDGLNLSIDMVDASISPIVKISIKICGNMIKSGYLHSVFVFPETRYIIGEFIAAYLISNIENGTIKSDYDLSAFVPKQKLKIGKCVCEFIELEEKNEGLFIRLKFKDLDYSTPISYAPYFQTTTSTRLSRYQVYKEAKDQIAEDIKKNKATGGAVLSQIKDRKTHLESSVIFVSKIKHAKEFLLSSEINGRKLTDLFLLAQGTGDGKVTNLSPGRLDGNPAVIIVPDLYAASAVMENHTVNTVIIDGTLKGIFESQLDALDSISLLDIPVVVVTDTVGSLSIEPLDNREFQVWRWDERSLIPSLYEGRSAVRVQNCATHDVEYKRINEVDISNAVNLLRKCRSEIDEQVPEVIDAFESCLSIAFNMLRMVVPYSPFEVEKLIDNLSSNSSKIERNSTFLPAELAADLNAAVTSLKEAIGKESYQLKINEISAIIRKNYGKRIAVVIPDRCNKSLCEKYYKEKFPHWMIRMIYPAEYKRSSEVTTDITIIPGWFSNEIMKTILFRYDSSSYIILNYPCETRWQKSHTKVWKETLSKSGNKAIVKASIKYKKDDIDTNAFDIPSVDITQSDRNSVDEFSDIDVRVKTNTYRKYSASGNANSLVEAVPVSFAGGNIAFYRKGHTIISATDLVKQESESTKNIKPEDLSIGDFVVVRESNRDLIRDIADIILKKLGKQNLRSVAGKWREALEVESVFSSTDEICHKIITCGCTRGYQTIKNWVIGDDIIVPQLKDDLGFIAKALDDAVLLEQIDAIYDAGMEVRNAHVKAGTILSERLRNRIAEEITALGDIDIFNIWDPINISIEDVGNVLLLKIIDIGDPVSVDSGYTNRLLAG